MYIPVDAFMRGEGKGLIVLSGVISEAVFEEKAVVALRAEGEFDRVGVGS